MKSERKRLTDRLDELVLKIVRLATDSICQRCGKKVYGCNSHPSHVVPKGNGASWRRFDLLNVQHLCLHCHLDWWHNNITEAGKWFAEKWPHLDDYLEKYRYGKPAKISTAEMKQLKEEYKQKLIELKEN